MGPEPSAKAGADNAAKMAEMVGWKVADAGSKRKGAEGVP